MIEIKTERLKLRPLNEQELKLAILDFNELEKRLNLVVTDKNIGIREKNVYKTRLNDMQMNLDRYEWYTPWIIISKERNRIIGAIMIKSYPNVDGEVIIGYALQEDFRRNGYMKEAVSALIDWIFKNTDVRAVIADTLKDNVPSHNLLKQLGMVIYKEDDECFWWKLENKSS